MVEVATVGRLFAGLVLLLGNGYFVTIEFAMTRVRQFPRSEFTGVGGLERAWEMTERLEIYLSGCQLGITICSVGLGVVAEPALAAIIDPVLLGLGVASAPAAGGHTALAVVVALGVINLLHLTVGEQAPTYLGIERTKFVARYGAPILYWWTTLLSPIIRLADWLAKAILSLFGVTITRSWAEEELEEEAAAGGERPARTRGELLSRMGAVLTDMDMDAERRREVINAIAIDQITAGDLMVDRSEIHALSIADGIDEALDTVREHPHTRFPLIDADLDDVVGTIYLPALVQAQPALEAGETTLADVASQALVVQPGIPISELIDEFQDAEQELALVREDGRTVGLITATDAAEAITGELEDPLDEET